MKKQTEKIAGDFVQPPGSTKKHFITFAPWQKSI